MSEKPCSWPVDYSQCGVSAGQPSESPVLPDPLEDMSPEEVEKFEQMAIDFLWHSSNRLFGTCPTVVRPCQESCGQGSTFWGGYPWAFGNRANGWTPALIGGQWYNLNCGCLNTCNCALDGTRTYFLPGPVASITRVLINGEVLPEDSYELTYGRVITLKDGRRFPVCQDLSAPLTEPGTFGIEYERGLPVPIGGQFAAGKLALELAKAYCGESGCELPERVQTVTRQGVTVGFMDLFEGLDEGRTGIWVIDSWLASVTRTRPVSGVRSPDIQPNRVGNRPWRI